MVFVADIFSETSHIIINLNFRHISNFILWAREDFRFLNNKLSDYFLNTKSLVQKMKLLVRWRFKFGISSTSNWRVFTKIYFCTLFSLVIRLSMQPMYISILKINYSFNVFSLLLICELTLKRLSNTRWKDKNVCFDAKRTPHC